MTPPTTSDLIFSEQANHRFSKTLGQLKRHTLSIQNRLKSILEDAAFVQRVFDAYERPLIANERCGSWYISPSNKHGSAYFKSTDGHTGVWSFSTRRLNTHLIETIGKHDGCIIVDSTRRGKRMPDALSKTIPIWCSILNRALFTDIVECHELHTPPQVVSSSEHAQISTRLEAFLLSFLALDIDRATLRSHITKPLRPIWVTPESYLSSKHTVFEDYHPIICCTASRRVPGGEVSEGGYIQGSGDDTENWAFNLNPPIFWANTHLLLSIPEAELPELISKLVATSLSSLSNQTNKLAPIPPTSSLHVTDLKTVTNHPASKLDLVIILYPDTKLPADIRPTTHNHLPIPLGPHKLGSRNLRTALPTIVSLATTHLSRGTLSGTTNSTTVNAFTTDATTDASSTTPELSITIACSTSTDHSIGVALALLCLFYDANGKQLLLRRPEGTRDPEDGGLKIDKLYIRRRLGWIMTAMPEANPSGATLQSVNGFLMPKQ